MAIFEKSIPIILAHEGGYVNNVNDAGGVTNLGVSLKFLQDYGSAGDFDHDGDVDAEDIRCMTKEQAMQIYKTAWWDKFGYGQIADQTIATKVFDFSVNMGAKRAHILLQRSLNSAFFLKLTEDGVLGPASMHVLNAVADGDQEGKLLTAYSDAVWGFYQSIITTRPQNAVFAKGWKNRAYSIVKPNSVV